MHTIDYGTVQRLCEPMLSEKGNRSYLKSRKAVLVYDKPSVIKKIRAIIDSCH
ncbi:MAG: hypothetical protein ACP5I4_15620 [Oceanipulchritudo sp.]